MKDLIKVRPLSLEDDFSLIGELIFHVDPWIYPDLFENEENAKRIAKVLLKKKGIYNLNNITVVEDNGMIVGFMVIIDSYEEENVSSFKEAFEECNISLPASFDRIMDEYFEEMNHPYESKEIVSLSVLPSYRNKGYASLLLSSLDKNETYTLTCVKDNKNALNLYLKNGFEIVNEVIGYPDIWCLELVRRSK